MLFDQINTATTLSIRYKPGQDTRIPTTKSDSLFTFGYFRMESNPINSINNSQPELSFGSFSTLESLNVETLDVKKGTSVLPNELRMIKSDPNSHVYFSSIYSEFVVSINNIVENFPYAILSNGFSSYSNFSLSGNPMSSFSIPVSQIVNQGSIIFNSGSTFYNPSELSLIDDTQLFSIQLSGQTISSNPIHEIYSYSFSSSSLNFVVYGHVITGGTSSSLPIYVRPTVKKYNEFFNNLDSIGQQLLVGQEFMVPNINDNKETLTSVAWPKTIDGFNPDVIGTSFQTYKDNILSIANRIDKVKTNWMKRTFIGENLYDYDSENADFEKIVGAFSHEFDQIKRYIDNMAYAYSVTYNGEQSVPDKFMYKLSNLLGWKLSNAFNEVDLFEYISGDVDGQNNSYSHYNLEIWKRILVNINWLYKKKGTRDALSFIFKLIGAPDCLVDFDEFVYRVKQASPIQIDPNNYTMEEMVSASKINQNGYPNYESQNSFGDSEQQYIFQQGGNGRGDGQVYINQWRPEFDPEKEVDNIKIVTGNSQYFGSQNIINSKEARISIDPARAVECGVFKFYMSADTCWTVGTTGSSMTYAFPVPSEYLPADCSVVNPSFISGMTLSQYMDFVFASNVDPKTRKTNNQANTTFYYPELKAVYMNYYLSSTPTDDCRLTIKKIEPFLEKIELQMQDYVFQLLPATTIMNSQVTVYRNPLFHRQRFVYRNGINTGSEFQVGLPASPDVGLSPIKISSSIIEPISPSVNQVKTSCNIVEAVSSGINSVSISTQFGNSLGLSITGVSIRANVTIGASLPVFVLNNPVGVIPPVKPVTP